MSYLFVDIRKSDEVMTKRFNESHDYKFYNIPMNMIRFNYKTIIDHLNYIDNIYIVCQSSRRSQFIKNKYFKEFENIKVEKKIQFNNFDYGRNEIKINNDKIIINVTGTKKFNLYSMMRIIQIVLGSMILILGGVTFIQMFKYKNKVAKIPLFLLLLFGLMAVYNGLTSTCTISEILKNKLN